MNVYVAAPYEDAPHVRALHRRLASSGITVTSNWAEEADGAENFSAKNPAQLRAIAANNDDDVQRSEAMIVLARAGAGGEMFAEARFACSLCIPVYWVGRLILTAWREGVTRCNDVDDAIAHLVLDRVGRP